MKLLFFLLSLGLAVGTGYCAPETAGQEFSGNVRVSLVLDSGLASGAKLTGSALGVVIHGPAAGVVWLPCDTYTLTGGTGSGPQFDLTHPGSYQLTVSADGTSVFLLDEAGSVNGLECWSAGFGFGLLAFGFGWIYRLTKHIPEA